MTTSEETSGFVPRALFKNGDPHFSPKSRIRLSGGPLFGILHMAAKKSV
jgi:hypothetical protein